MGKLILIIGGSASGKSAFGEKLLHECCPQNKLYIATMKLYDEESVKRVEKHKTMRKDKHFDTIESYDQNLDLVRDVASRHDGALFECLSNYITNCMFMDEQMEKWTNGANEQEEISLANNLCEELFKVQGSTGYLVVMSAEVFSDGRKYDAGTESYKRVLALCNRILAKKADEVYEVICGIPKKRK